MKTRNANDIRRDLKDAKRRLRELEIHGNAAMPVHHLSSCVFADDFIMWLEEKIDDYKQELEEVIRHGEQLAFAF